MIKPTLSVRVYDFLVSTGVSSLRDIYEALNETPSSVGDCLKRLWKKGFILRTKEPVFRFETHHKGRAGIIGYNRTINYYIVNDGDEIDSQYVVYSDRKKDGRSKGIESKASKIVNFLKKNMDQAFYSVDIVKTLWLNLVT